jgi:hypothetical protein
VGDVASFARAQLPVVLHKGLLLVGVKLQNKVAYGVLSSS